MFVKLQRPPPEMSIFLPVRSPCSRTATRRPRLPASIAHISPAAPAPSMTASNLWASAIQTIVRESNVQFCGYAIQMHVSHRPRGDQTLVQIVNAALAESARKSGPWLVCRPGCTQCCFGPFAINQLDAARLRDGLAELKREDPQLAELI